VVFRAIGGRWANPGVTILDRGKLLRMMAVNRDIMIRTLALVGTFVIFTRQGAQDGATVLAANAILYNLFGLAAYFLDGFATAAEQIGGKAVGARDGAQFREAVRLTSLWAIAFGLVATLVLFLAGPLAIDMMTIAPEVREAARRFLPYAALTPIIAVMAFQFDGIFIGATWTAAMRNCMVAALALFLAAIVLLQPYGNHGLWLAFLIFLGARGLFQGVMYPRLARATFP
jgi:MATE family multidrug resistance protein